MPPGPSLLMNSSIRVSSKTTVMKTSAPQKTSVPSRYWRRAKTRTVPLLLCAVVSLCFCSCGTVKLKEDSTVTKHIIMADENGEPFDPRTWGTMKLTNFTNIYLNELVQNVEKRSQVGPSGKRRILIFVHGGLNTASASVKRAVDLYSVILTNKDDSYYPIFINWRSGLTSSYFEH